MADPLLSIKSVASFLEKFSVISFQFSGTGNELVPARINTDCHG